MRKKVTLLVMAAFLFSSCAFIQRITPQTPEERLALAYNTYAMTLETAVDLYEAERISMDTLEQINEYAVYVRRALDQWANALEHDLDPYEAEKAYRDGISRIRDAMEGD